MKPTPSPRDTDRDLRRGWLWVNPDYAPRLPAGLIDRIHDVPVDDRHHTKQGRSTGRLRIDAAGGPIAVYLKRHERWPGWDVLRARLGRGGPFSPAGVEWRNLEEARRLGVAVPDTVAAGERIEADGRPRSFLMVREIAGEELHLAAPRLSAAMHPAAYARLKRGLIPALARVVARLHRARRFHKDLYLCHVFLEADEARPVERRLTMIDLHRLACHPWTAWRWRWKDIGQLLFSTYGVVGIDDRDRLRFWMHYRRALGLRWSRLERAAVVAKAARYRSHNQGA